MDLGRIRQHPIAKRWIWPYADMRIGDSFWVAEEDRHPGAVRSHAYSEGYRLHRKFKVTRDKAGARTVVERIEPDAPRREKVRKTWGYGEARTAVAESYGFNLDRILWETVARQRVDAERIFRTISDDITMDVHGMLFKLDFDAKGFDVQALDNRYDETLELMS